MIFQSKLLFIIIIIILDYVWSSYDCSFESY